MAIMVQSESASLVPEIPHIVFDFELEPKSLDHDRSQEATESGKVLQQLQKRRRRALLGAHR
jgi:hypothetical protein